MLEQGATICFPPLVVFASAANSLFRPFRSLVLQDPVVQAAAAPAVRMQRSALRKHAFALCVGAPCGVVPLSGCSLAGNSTMNEHMHSNNYLA